MPLVLEEFHLSANNLDSTLIVSIWELGEVVGQFFVGPLSELYGRMPVYHAGNVFFIICSVAAALSTNISMLIAFRFLNGVAITSLTLGPSIVGDMFKKEERGTAMSIAIALPLLGPFIAPIVGGYVADALGWRWTIWLVAIVVGVVTLFSFAVFKETYAVKILQVKAARLRKETGNENFQSPSQEKKRLLGLLIKPMHMLFSSIVVFVISLYTALTYGISYMILTTMAEIMQKTYGFGEGPLGITFLGRGTFLFPFLTPSFPNIRISSCGEHSRYASIRPVLRPIHPVQKGQRRDKARASPAAHDSRRPGASTRTLPLRLDNEQRHPLDRANHWNSNSRLQYAA